MKLLFIKVNADFLKQFLRLLIPNGIEFGVVEYFNDALSILKTNEYNLIICDIDRPKNKNEDASHIQLINFLNENHLQTKIVMLTSKSDPVFLKNYLYRYIFGFIYKNNSVIDINKQFNFILNSIKNIRLNRKFVRVKPALTENVILKIKADNVNLEYNITDLSVKGVAFKLNPGLQTLISGKYYSNMEISINNKILNVDGKCLLKEKFGFIIFNKLANYIENLLCKYIADKMVEFNDEKFIT